jgi:uncharacterized protein
VVPVSKALLYVQPLYLQAEQTKLPQLKEVIVFHQAPEGASGGAGQAVAMEPTLGQSLADIFGSAPPVGPTPSPTPSARPGGPTPTPTPTGTSAPGQVSAQARALIQQANKEFEAAQAALKAGNFAEYGRQVDALKATLSKLQRLQ